MEACDDGSYLISVTEPPLSVIYPIIILFVCKDSALYGCTTR